ncbi:MAG: hypothetical protein CBD97_02000 [Pelagibacteraceae bacterium TMED237]|nr:MAG: hypothetical protein CBD97_02000 [Pelagibacteraceae bacterium TMED237]|tara:strand:+ start:2796 stop:3965 length:1170 start_codon:yes stop_codon:yes gene_type:complete
MNHGYRQFISKTYKIPYYYNIYNDTSTWEPKIIYDNEKIDNIIDKDGKIWIPVSSKKFENQIYWHLKNTNKNQWSFPIYTNINKWNKKLLQWTGNSCYCDSVLQCLFYLPNYFTHTILHGPVNTSTCSSKAVTEIQSELSTIADTIRGNVTKTKDVRKLRSKLEKCKRKSENFHGTEFRDAGEYLGYLLDFFPISNTKVEIEDKYYLDINNKVVKQESRTINSTITINIDLNIKSNNLNDFLKQVEDTGKLEEPIEGKYYRIITNKKIEAAPYLVFEANRRDMDDNVNDKFINIPENINLYEQIFICVGIVIYVGAHFVCVFRDEFGIWWYYNDYPSPKIRRIGSFENMLLNDKIRKMISTWGTLYFYMKNTEIQKKEWTNLEKKKPQL